MVPATILWQISGLSCSFHQRHTHFFISHQSNHGKSSKLVSLFFVVKSPCCRAASYRVPQTFSMPQTSALFTHCILRSYPLWMSRSLEGRHTNRSFSALVYDGYRVPIFSFTKNFRLSIQPDLSTEMVPLEKGGSNERFEKVFQAVPFQC